MFCLVSGAHYGPISRIWSEFDPGPIQDLKIVFFFLLGHGPPWLAGHVQPGPAMARHCPPWPAMASHGQPWPTVVSHVTASNGLLEPRKSNSTSRKLPSPKK